jgi:inorganic pyrophosphatase
MSIIWRTIMMRLGHHVTIYCLMLALGCSIDTQARLADKGFAPGTLLLDEYTLVGERSFITGYAPITDEGYVTVVVEMPTGTLENWKVSQPTGFLKLELEKSRPRLISYLPCIGNCGIIPQTIMAQNIPGDGRPIDVLLLGPPLPRGVVVAARPVAVLRLFDEDLRDDKIIAVRDDFPFAQITDLSVLESEFPGVTIIINEWFCNNDKRGKVRTIGFGDAEEARKMIRSAAAAFARDSTRPLGVS